MKNVNREGHYRIITIWISASLRIISLATTGMVFVSFEAFSFALCDCTIVMPLLQHTRSAVEPEH